MDARVRTILFAIISLFIVFLWGCDITNSPGVYNLATNATPEEGGSVTPSSGEFGANTEVQLEAEPAEGYRFAGWDGDLSGSSNPDTITIDSDKQVNAVFEVREYALQIDTRGEGRVKEEIIEQAGKGDYEHGTTVQLTAEPADGWRFVGWEGDLEGDENPVTLEIEEEKQVTAVFERREYVLSITIEGDGAVSEEVVREKAKDYKHGTVVRLTAEPAEGWTFARWEGDLEGGENPEVITIEEEKNVTAVFERQTHTLTTDVEGEGEIQLDPDRVEFGAGEEVTLTAEPQEGWRFVRWENDLESEENPETITVDADKEITAIFEFREYPLNIKIEGEGTVDEEVVEGKAKDYEHGTTVRLTAEAAYGWEFDRWKGDLEGDENPETIEIVEEKNVTAVFEAIEDDDDGTGGGGGNDDNGDDGDGDGEDEGDDEDDEDDGEESEEFTVDLSTEGEGTIARDPEREQYESGEEVTLTAEPKEGWEFAGWKGDLESQENPETITVDEDKEITAVFEEQPETFTITTSVEGEGSVAVEPDHESYEDGEEVTVTAEPEEGWSFSQWGEGDFSGEENPVTFNIDQNKDITAVFEEDPETFTITTSVEGEGSVAVDPDQESYQDGEEVTVTAEPTEGWSFSHWGEGDFSGEENPVTFNIDQNKEITAVFETATVSHDYVEGVTPEDLNPDNAERTYPVFQADWPGPGGDKRWLGWNLGATDAPRSIDDDNTDRAGWYFQFNRLQGYRHDGEGNERIDNFPVSDIGVRQDPQYDSDWIDNDPCTESLGENWRVPTRDEWKAVILANAGKELNLHFTGSVSYNLGALFGLGERGSYWTSTQYIDEHAGSTNAAYAVSVSDNYDLGSNIIHMKWGKTVRCIED